jgi:hypothetical protein
MLVVENAKLVSVEDDNCALVVAAVVPMAVADVDVVVVVTAAVVDAFVIAVVGKLVAVQVAIGRLEQEHREGFVAQSCGFM